MTQRREILNKEKIKTLGEKETYKYLGIFEADTIKHAEMEHEHIKKRITQEIEKTSLKDKYLGSTPCKIIGTINKFDEGRI